MSRHIACFVALLLIFTVNSVYAAHPLITDDAGTLGKGTFQFEIAGEYGDDDENAVSEESSELAISLGYGLNDVVDLVFGVPYQATRTEEAGTTVTEDGAGDVSLDLKWLFYDRESLSLVLKPGISLPTGDDEKGLGTGRATYSAFFVATRVIPFMAVHLNLGYIGNENKVAEREDLWHVSLAAEMEICTNLKAVGNLGAERNADPASDTHPAFLLGGLVYSLNENVDLDLGLKGGLSDPETDFSVLAGITLTY